MKSVRIPCEGALPPTFNPAPPGDPYEFYEYVHVTEVGNTSGSGFGGMVASQGMYTNRLLEKPIQKDILQEHFINTMPAWVARGKASPTDPTGKTTRTIPQQFPVILKKVRQLLGGLVRPAINQKISALLGCI